MSTEEKNNHGRADLPVRQHGDAAASPYRDGEQGGGAPPPYRAAEKPSAMLKPLREEMTRKARELARSAVDLEQAALFPEPEFEEALLLPPEEVEKRYTGAQRTQIEWRRKACIKLLARQASCEDIADILSMNHRTVSAIASQEYTKLAAFSEQFAEVLLSDAASTLAIARSKREGAPYNQLMFGAGVLMTHAATLKMIGAGAGDLTPAVDVASEDPRRKAFIERLKQLKPVVEVAQ